MVADLLTLARIPLGVVFLLVAGDTRWALAVLVVAGLTDVFDGIIARRHATAQSSHRGDWLDPLCDKLFALGVVIGLWLTRSPPLGLLFLLLLRETLQLIAVTVMRVCPSLQRAAREFDFKAHPMGKAATVAQFATSAAILLGLASAWPLGILCASLGVASVGIYIQRIRGLVVSANIRRRRA